MTNVANESNDKEKAVKYYSEAYTMFDEMGIEDTAALVSYKLSKFNIVSI